MYGWGKVSVDIGDGDDDADNEDDDEEDDDDVDVDADEDDGPGGCGSGFTGATPVRICCCQARTMLSHDGHSVIPARLRMAFLP